MSDYIRTDKVLDRLAGVVAEIIKMPPEHTEEHTETHSCVSEHTETHDLISRKEAIKAVCSVCGETECNIFDPDIKAKLYCPEPYAIMKLPSAEPMEIHHRYEQGIIEGRVQMRTEMLKAIKDIVGDEVWNGI